MNATKFKLKLVCNPVISEANELTTLNKQDIFVHTVSTRLRHISVLFDLPPKQGAVSSLIGQIRSCDHKILSYKCKHLSRFSVAEFCAERTMNRKEHASLLVSNVLCEIFCILGLCVPAILYFSKIIIEIYFV